jgi:hypothetical protein
MTTLLNGDDPEFKEISPMITTLRHDLDQKIRRLVEALSKMGVAATELEKLRIALEGTAPAALVGTIAHGTAIPIPADAVIVAKKHELMRALETADNAFVAVREGVTDVLSSASLPKHEPDAGRAGAGRIIRLPQLTFKNQLSTATRPATSTPSGARTGVAANWRPALGRLLPN